MKALHGGGYEGEHGRAQGSGVVRRRVRLSESPLSTPDSPIRRLAASIQDFIHLPDPNPLYTAIAAVAGNMAKGEPIWMMYVGAPSTGKTLQLDMLGGLMYDLENHNPQPGKHIYDMGGIQTEGALISGVKQSERVKGASGGLLRRIGPRGMLVSRDFARMFSQDHKDLVKILGALRDVYDGKYVRHMGTDGGMDPVWKGRLGFIGASTYVIDRYADLIKDLGERWVYYRFESSDGYHESMKAMSRRDPAAAMKAMQDKVVAFFEEMDLRWDKEERLREPTKKEANRLHAMARLATAARSPVARDKFSYQIMEHAEKEGPTRMNLVLSQLYLALERIGVVEEERWVLIGRIALDSIPALRAKAVLALRGSWVEQMSVGLTVGEIQQVLGVGSRAVEVTVGDLEAHGVVEMMDGKHRNWFKGVIEKDIVRLTPWAREQVELGWGKAKSRPVEEE